MRTYRCYCINASAELFIEGNLNEKAEMGDKSPTRELTERLNFSHTFQTIKRYSERGDSPVRIVSRKLGLLAYEQPVISSILVGKNGSN